MAPGLVWHVRITPYTNPQLAGATIYYTLKQGPQIRVLFKFPDSLCSENVFSWITRSDPGRGTRRPVHCGFDLLTIKNSFKVFIARLATEKAH